MDEVKDEPMSPTVERANKVLMERHSSSSGLPRMLLGLVVVLAALLAASLGVFAYQLSRPQAQQACPAQSNLTSTFRAWMAQHGQAYATPAEEAAAFAQFERTHARITAHNQQNSTITLGHNAYSATPFSQFFHRGIVPRNSTTAPRYYNSSLAGGRRLQTAPASKDWRTEGYVTPIKNQGQCGSCWSFATTGALEGGYKAATGHLVSFSEQNLVSCANIGGCAGSNLDESFSWVASNGDATESEYPYAESIDGQNDPTLACTRSREVPFVTTQTYYNVRSTDLMHVVGTQGPVAATISVSCCPTNNGFQSYRSGIITSSNYNTPEYTYEGWGGWRRQLQSCEPDHAILIVGYGTSGSTDYWIVKNSWGTTWGDAGYFYVERGSNTCLLEQGAVMASGVEAYTSGR